MKVMLTMATAALAIAGWGGELTVSPNGMAPDEALTKIRAARKAGDRTTWTVTVRGVNFLERTLVFTPDDHDVIFIGESGAAFSGGRELTDWKDSGKGWLEAECPRMPDGGVNYVDQLWVGGRRAERARLPNTGYLKLKKPGIKPFAGSDGKTVYRETATPIGDLSALAAVTPDEMKYVQLCVIHKWAFSRRILRGFDAKSGLVETISPRNWTGWQSWNESETLVHFENVRAAFDAPGEWFQDMKAGKILYRPLPGETAANLKAVAPFSHLSRLVDFRGVCNEGRFVRNVTFRGIAFLHSDSTRPAGCTGPVESWQHQAAIGSDGAVMLTGVAGVKFIGCEISHTGNYAMRFSDGCVSNEVVGCTLTDLGAGGVWMGEDFAFRDRLVKTPRKILRPVHKSATAFNLISNCTITCGGRYNPEGTGVALTHCSDTKVVHNDIHDFFYTGVSVGWTWGFSGSLAQRNEIAWNTIYDLGKKIMSDMGGVYTLGTSFGTRVHHNVIHDVFSYSYGGWALYTDEGSEGIVMENNVCWNTTDGGFHQHYGTGCVIRNNVFAFNRELGAVRMARTVVQDIPCTLHFVNNIVYVDHGPLVGKGVRNVGGVWANNVWYDVRGVRAAEFDGDPWEKWVASDKERGSVFADPLFRNAKAHDFALLPESPALRLGFKPIDLAGVGPVR